MAQDQNDIGSDRGAAKWARLLAETAPPAATIPMEDVKRIVRELKPSLEVTDWVKWEEAGQTVEGVIVRHERDVQGQYAKRQDLIKLKDGDVIYGIRCPSMLQRLVRDNDQVIQIGKTRLRIVFTGKEAYGDGTRAKYGFELYTLE